MKCENCGKESELLVNYKGTILCSLCQKAVKKKEAEEIQWIERMRMSSQPKGWDVKR